MPALRDLQRSMRAFIVAREISPTLDWIAWNEIAPEDRLRLYRNAYLDRLITSMRLTYPATVKLVGTAFFDGACLAFIGAHSPTSACLHDYGAEFADFLAAFPAARELAYLHDVARLEWAVSIVAHSPDVAALTPADLMVIEPRDHARVCLSLHPAFRLLRLDCPADAIWRAVLDGDDAALAALDVRSGTVWLALARGAEGVQVERMDERRWRFMAAIAAGRPLGEAIDLAGDIDAAGVLARHIAADRFVGFTMVGGKSGKEQPT